MAGVSLPSITRRLKTVTNTRKITKAMALVSSSKYQKSRIALYRNSVHFESLREIVREVIENTKDRDSIYFKNDFTDKKLYIIFNSDRGLVGAYNSQLISLALSQMQQEKEIPYIISTGKKGMGIIRRLLLTDKSEVISLGDLPTFDDISELYEHVFALYKSGFINEVKLIYTKYISPVSNTVVSESLLPFSVEELKLQSVSTGKSENGNDDKNEVSNFNTEFEFIPNSEEMLDDVFRMYLKEKLYNTILNAKTAEQSIRMSSMNSSTKNADEIILSLNKTYNRLRQSAITQEISEIVGGAEALR